MHTHRVRVYVFLPLALLLAAASVAAPPASQHEKVRVGELPILPSIGTFLALDRGYFAEQGLDVELVMFKTGSEMIPLLATGQLDVGGLGIDAGLYNAVARGGRLWLVADKGHHPYRSSPSPVHAVVLSQQSLSGDLNATALKGKVFAVAGRGNPQEIYLDRVLRRYGSSIEDVQVYTMPFPSMISGLASGTIFGASLLEPFLTIAQTKGVAVPLLADTELHPGQQGGVVVYSDHFARARESVAVRYLAAYLKGVRYYCDFLAGAVGVQAVFPTVKAHTSIESQALFSAIGKPELDPEGRLNLQAMQEDLRWFQERGYVPETPDLAAMVDGRFAEGARALLSDTGPAGQP